MPRGVFIAAGLMLAAGAAAAARTSEGTAHPRTLATVPGSIGGLTQNGPRIAWIRPQARCGSQIQVLTPRSRRLVSLGSRQGIGCSSQPPKNTIALDDHGRVLWQKLIGGGNTLWDIDLFTAALRAPRTRRVGRLEFSNDQGFPDTVLYRLNGGPLPVAAAGNTMFVLSPTCKPAPGRDACAYLGALERIAGSHPRPVAWYRASPIVIGAGGSRVVVVTNNAAGCCNDTPVWSRDGTRLAWIHHGGDARRGILFTIGADGKDDRQLATRAALPSWSPDGRRIVFEREEAQKRHAVYGVASAGGRPQRLATGSAPVWSPDGTRIAFVRGSHVYSIDASGQNERRLTTTARATTGPLSWSPDSTQIAAWRGRDIYTVRADGAGERRLVQGGQPAWAPNGEKIAYAGAGGIGVVAADGTGATRVTSAGKEQVDDSPAWSPDSTRIAYVHSGDSDPRLWVTNANGTGQHRLAPSRGAVSPRWAPNGESIAVADYYDPSNTDFPSDGGLYLISPQHGSARKLAPALHSAVELRTAATGRLIRRFTADGHTRAAALTAAYLVLLSDHNPGVRLELYNLRGSPRTSAAVPSSVSGVSASGRSVVFATGPVVRRLDAGTGSISSLATARGRLVGPTIEGHRVVWAENLRGSARIRAATVP